MFAHKNKKEEEYNKARSITRKKEKVKIFKSIYKFFYYFLVLSFFVVLIYSLIFSKLLDAEDIEIIGLESLSLEDVTATAEKIYSGKYLGIISKKNYLFFPINDVRNALKENFKRIKKIDTEKQFPNKISFVIEERKSMLIWCGAGDKCYIIDEDGFAYVQLELDSKEAIENNLVKIISGELNREISVGEKILNSKSIEFFLDSSDRFFKKSKVELTGEVFVNSRMAEEAILKSKEGWDIYVSTSFPLEKGAEMLKLFLAKDFINENERRNLEYIDLRIENRTYYKFRNEENIKEEIESEKY